jgi:hypothetical protein
MASAMEEETTGGTISRLTAAERAIKSLRVLVEALERRVGKVELRLAGASFLGSAFAFATIELARYLKSLGG